MKKRKSRGIKSLSEPQKTRHRWYLREYKFPKDEINEYIIPNLSEKDAIILFKSTNDEKYIAHIFFKNLGYFINAIANSLWYFGEEFRYTDARDYVYEAYACILEAAKKFDLSKSDKVLSYLSGAIFLQLRKSIRDSECRYWKEAGLVMEEDETLEDASAVKDHGEVVYYENAHDVETILNELFNTFRPELESLGINSADELFRVYGTWSELGEKQKSALARLRRKMKRYLQLRYGEFFIEP